MFPHGLNVSPILYSFKDKLFQIIKGKKMHCYFILLTCRLLVQD